jgi:GcrA cell cycle regulator
MNWTDRRIERLRRVVAEGVSASAIAKKLGAGCTKGMVAGKIRRLQLTERPTNGTRTSKPSSLRTERSSPPERSSIALAPKPLPIAIERIKSIPLCPREAGQPRGLRIWDLRDAHCRWPLGDDCPPKLFCAAPVVGTSSWCAAHQRLAYQRASAAQAAVRSTKVA